MFQMLLKCFIEVILVKLPAAKPRKTRREEKVENRFIYTWSNMVSENLAKIYR